MEFLELARARYSCKAFCDRPVEDGKLAAVLEAGRLAPTAKNSQEQRVYVLRSPEVLAKLDGLTPCRYGAPVVLAVGYDQEGCYPYPGGRYDSGAEDAAIVATHMMLAAADQALDTCWLNRFDPDETARALGLPEGQRLVALLDLGYAAPGAGPLPNHSSRKELSETVVFL